MRWDDGEEMSPTDVKRERLKALAALVIAVGLWVLVLWLLPG